MSEKLAPVSIEHSNAWFFAIMGSIIAPWLALPDRLEVPGLVVILAMWACVIGVWMRREHMKFLGWLSVQDDRTLEALVSNYRIGSIRQRAVRAELAKRSSHAGPTLT